MTRIVPTTTAGIPEPVSGARAKAVETAPQPGATLADTVQIRASAAEAALSSLAGNASQNPEVIVTSDRWENLPEAPGDASTARELAQQIRAMMLKRKGG